jgi:hypothetical protein
MFLDELRTLPDNLVARLDPTRVQQYLRATGWSPQARSRNKAALYQRPEADLEQVGVPLSRELRDFTPRMAEAVAYVAEWEKRPALAVLHDLLLPPSDLLRFSQSGPAADMGDVPFDSGVNLLVGIRKALRAAVVSVRGPSFGSDPDVLLHRCRLGQTERDGFTVTVACPLDGESDTEPPFARRVTEWLMRSLHRLCLALEADNPGALLTPSRDEPVIPAELCEGLLEMQPEGQGAALTISVCWDRTMPPAAPRPERVRLEGATFGRLAAFARTLKLTPTAQGA